MRSSWRISLHRLRSGTTTGPKLTDSLMRCLTTTNIIENPNGRVREVTRRVARYRDAQMALRRSATDFPETGKRFRKIAGHKDLRMLEVALGRRSARVVTKWPKL